MKTFIAAVAALQYTVSAIEVEQTRCDPQKCPDDYTFWNPDLCICDCELKYPPRGCPEGSVLDEDCCQCVVAPCKEKECPGHYNIWNPDSCDCECLLETSDQVNCPAGTELNTECCSCEAKACVKKECDTSAFFVWDEDACDCVCDLNCGSWPNYVDEAACKCMNCEDPPSTCLPSADNFFTWDPLNCRCYCDTKEPTGRDRCEGKIWNYETCSCEDDPCEAANCFIPEIPNPND